MVVKKFEKSKFICKKNKKCEQRKVFLNALHDLV